MKMFLPLVAEIELSLPQWATALCLLLILLPILFILFIAFYSKKARHQQIMSAMEKGLPVADFMPKPLTDKQIGIRNLSAGIGFLCIGLGLIWVWYYAIEAPGIDVVPNWVCIIGAVIAGMGVLFSYRGVLQMQSSGMNARWFTKLATGIGFLSVALALTVVFGIARSSSIPDLHENVLIVAGVFSGLGLMLLLMGILQKKYEKQKTEGNTP